jgi:hypothetical protein
MIAFIKLPREPLFIFVVVGIVLYVFFFRSIQNQKHNERQIVVSAGQIELLETSFQKTWNRPPTESELQAQINNFIMDEVFFKEAVAMGLDKKDPAVKRRMRQIIEMMLDDFATLYPTESQLQQYLAENPDNFYLPAEITFEHLYFKQENKGEADRAVKALRSAGDIRNYSENELLLIPSAFERVSAWEVERLFGKPFTIELFNLKPGDWQGPVESAYGWHLVKIGEMVEGSLPDLAAVRDLVEREWMVEQRKQVKEKQYEKMRARYDIVIDYPDQ